MQKKMIVGYGVAGRGVHALLSQSGVPVCIFDDQYQGDDSFSGDWRTISEAIISPGFPMSHFIFSKIKEHQIPWRSELDLAFDEMRGRVICVTGTNGKSTVATMLASVLTNSVCCGNIGHAACTAVCQSGGSNRNWIIETSSYQIEHARTFSPDIVLITSLSYDHVERHGTLDHYHMIKLRFDVPTILPETLRERVQELGIERDFYFVEPANYGLHSEHDNLNASLVARALLLLGERRLLAHDFQSFRPLPHRFEKVATMSRVCVNDSKATNLEATLVAVKSMSQSVKTGFTLLVGGKRKGEDFSVLRYASNLPIQILCFGEHGAEIARETGGTFIGSLAETLDSKEFAISTGPVLFSPGCASFDEFKNFEERGEFFTAKVTKIFGNALS